MSAFNKLAAENVKVIMGAVASSVTLAVAPLADRDHILLISPASTSPKITAAGDFVFRVIPSDDLRGRVFAEYMFEDKKIGRVAILYVNNEGGVGGMTSFKRRYTELGGRVVAEEAYDQAATDLRSQITKAKGSDAGAVVVLSYPRDTILVMRQARIGVGQALIFPN